jgi:hypothetical protein
MQRVRPAKGTELSQLQLMWNSALILGGGVVALPAFLAGKGDNISHPGSLSGGFSGKGKKHPQAETQTSACGVL